MNRKIRLSDIEFIKEDIIIIDDYSSKTWCPDKHTVIDKNRFKNFKNNLRGWSRTVLNKYVLIQIVNENDNPEYYI